MHLVVDGEESELGELLLIGRLGVHEVGGDADGVAPLEGLLLELKLA